MNNVDKNGAPIFLNMPDANELEKTINQLNKTKKNQDESSPEITRNISNPILNSEQKVNRPQSARNRKLTTLSPELADLPDVLRILNIAGQPEDDINSANRNRSQTAPSTPVSEKHSPLKHSNTNAAMAVSTTQSPLNVANNIALPNTTTTSTTQTTPSASNQNVSESDILKSRILTRVFGTSFITTIGSVFIKKLLEKELANNITEQEMKDILEAPPEQMIQFAKEPPANLTKNTLKIVNAFSPKSIANALPNTLKSLMNQLSGPAAMVDVGGCPGLAFKFWLWNEKEKKAIQCLEVVHKLYPIKGMGGPRMANENTYVTASSENKSVFWQSSGREGAGINEQQLSLIARLLNGEIVTTKLLPAGWNVSLNLPSGISFEVERQS